MVRFFISTSKGVSVQALRLRKRNQLLLSSRKRCKAILREIKGATMELEHRYRKCA